VSAVLFLESLPLAAQEDNTGVGIATLSAGAGFGVGVHGSYGASLADAATKHVLAFVDFSYSPLTSYAFTYGTNNAGKGLYTSSLFDINGGIKIRFPNRTHWVPYIGVGAGLLRFDSTSNTSGFGTTASISQSNNEIAGNASVGGLYYITGHIGIQIEAKGYVAHPRHFGRATAGLFFQFP